MSKFIIVVRTTSIENYESIRADLGEQFKGRGLEIPFFALLWDDSPDIEILWIDEDMEMEKFVEIMKKPPTVFNQTIQSPNPANDFRTMQALAGT